MSELAPIRLSGVGKLYKIFPSRIQTALDALGIARFLPWWRVKHQEFWALRGIDLEVKAGSRLGIIGRNGAGKSTLLKLITGNVAQTEGRIEVNGEIQALLQTGVGFHPEFTGYENIRASLTYQGMTRVEIEPAIAEIAEFTELGQFLSQPFRTFSSGMQARLAFATATALKPDILIIDEILGAGDAYFASKSSQRMKELVEESGATVLLVSHALDHVARYCDECIWVERGRVVMRGRSQEVINAYQEFGYRLEDRRLKAKHRRGTAGSKDQAASDGYRDVIMVALEATGSPGAHCDVSEATLLANDQPEETLNVGDVQDINPGYTSMVSMTVSDWSDPKAEAGCWFRSLRLQLGGPVARGELMFYLYALIPEIKYSCRIRYRCVGSARAKVTISHNGERLGIPTNLPADSPAWQDALIPVVLRRPSLTGREMATAETALGVSRPTAAVGKPIRRWPGEGSIRIERAALLGADGQERGVFEAGSTLTVRMELRARRTGHFNLVVGATLLRLDDVFVCNLVSEPTLLHLSVDECRSISATLEPLVLCDGQYVFSLSVFEGAVLTETRYDLISRGYEFRVIGNPPVLLGAVFRHPATWALGGATRCGDR